MRYEGSARTECGNRPFGPPTRAHKKEGIACSASVTSH